MSDLEFKLDMDHIDRQGDKKYFIAVRQALKHTKKVNWRKCKLRYVKNKIKELETTTKSRGGRLRARQDTTEYE